MPLHLLFLHLHHQEDWARPDRPEPDRPAQELGARPNKVWYEQLLYFATTNWMLSLDERVSLTSKQREEVVEAIRKGCPKREPLAAPMPVDVLSRTIRDKYAKLEGLKDLLTKDQVTQWQDVTKQRRQASSVGFRPTR